MSKIIQGKFKILSNKKAGCDYYKMIISAREIVKAASPGQFVHLLCAESNQPLLRRPFSFHRLNNNNFEILYEVIGQGTHLLTKRKKGERIDVLGPLGNGFDFIRNTEYGIRNTILVAGGMGVAPLFALAEDLLKKKKNILLLLGARDKKHILCERDFKKLGANVQIATDDGSLGYKGQVTELLKNLLRRKADDGRRTTVYACGPKEMLKELSNISARFDISAYGSLEENMACGVGACLGCAVETKQGYSRVCKEGPVFNLKDIKW